MADVPPAFSKVVARAMAKDRGDRPATTGEFLKELKTALANSEQGIGADHLHSAPSPRTSVETRSDVNAATVVTMGVAGAPQTHPNVAPPALLETETIPSSSPDSIATPQVSATEEPARSIPAPAIVSSPTRSSRKVVFPIVLISFLLIAGVTAVGGYFI